MGIPHLTRDVAPHAVSITFGARTPDKTADVIDKVVIDGPSLVYHVYHLVLKQQALQHASNNLRVNNLGARAHPPYSLINDTVIQFLHDLRSVGVTILRIYFDGALPLTKRSTRQQRVEQGRRQLEKCRQNCPAQPPVEVEGGAAAVDARSILWQTRACVGFSSQLPPAPFIVPAAIERLVATLEWTDLIEIVPGESDAYCAALGAQEAAGILSNDSDLLLHDLGDRASVIGFHSLEFEADTPEPPVLRGSCLRPQDVARGLGVVKLKEYGFQRYLDSQATSRRISERTRGFTLPPRAANNSYQEFCTDFSTAALIIDSKIISCETLRELDPRVAELVCAFSMHHSPQIYFPVLCEDQTRDSAWLYGAEIRQIAYSIYVHFGNPPVKADRDPVVMEHLRKGKTIRGFSVQCLSREMLTQKVAEFASTHQEFVDSSGLSQPHQLFGYHALAARLVQLEKKKQSKSSLYEISNLLARNSTSKFQPSWDDVHVLACIHAVLYSIRILKQLLRLAVKAVEPVEKDQSQLEYVTELLKPLPAIEHLILNPTELSSKLQKVPYTTRVEALKIVEAISHSRDHNSFEGTQVERPSQKSSSQANKAISNLPSTFSETSPQRTKRKKAMNESHKNGKSNTPERIVDGKRRIYYSNPFALLDGG